MYMPVSEIIPQVIYFIKNLLKSERAYTTPVGDVYYAYSDGPPRNRLSKEIFEHDEVSGGRV